jgi:hypothetical protein
MNLLDVYKSLLSTAGMSADPDGFISIQLAGTEKKPFLVKGKRLVLPTDTQLRNPDFTNRVVFHPLSESILRGESEVVTAFRETLVKRLNFIIGYVAINLLDLAVSTAVHSKLAPEQTEFLAKVKDTDEKTIHCLQKITEAMMIGDNSRAFVHLRVQKNGTIGTVKHRRVGIAYFPFYEEVKKIPAPKEINEIYGIKLRKNDRETFKVLMEYMISGIENSSSWMFASNSEIAPTLDSLMKTLIAIGDPINTVVDLFKNYIEGSDDLYFNGEWEESFSDLNAMHTQIRMIPMQPGNEGRIQPDGNNVISVNTAVPQVPMTQSASVVAKPQPLGQTIDIQKQAIKPPSGGLSGMAVDEQSTRPVQPQPHPMQPMMMHQQAQPAWAQPVGYGQQGYPAPVAYPPMQQPVPQQPVPGTVVMVQTHMGPQQMMVNQVGQLVPLQQAQQFNQPQPQIQRTGRGIDFNSVLAANPHMAAQSMGMMQHPQMGYGGAPSGQSSQPGWARPDTMNWANC